MARSGGGGGSRPSRPTVNNVFINNPRADFDRTPSFGGPVSYGGGYSGGGYGSSKKKSGSGVGKTVLTLVIIFGIIFLILALFSLTANRDIPDSTIERKPLPVGAAQGDVIVYRDDTGDGDWFDNRSVLMAGAKSPVEILAPWIIVGFVICLIIGIMPAILRMKARKKEAEAERMRAEAELLGAPIAGLDTEPMSASELADKYLAEQGIPITPQYKAPENPLDDPYSPKPAGYAAKQAEMGYPKSQAVRPPVSPEEADLSDDNELVFGTFESFATAMRGLGSDDSDEELMARYEQYKKENNIED